MKVLVTGSTGRVGANFVRRIVLAGAEVRAMIMPKDPQRGKLEGLGAEIIEADLTDQDSIDAACRGVTHVVHLAAQLVRGGTPVDRFYDINAFGTLRLLEGTVQAGGVERFVLASTDGTYRPGNPPKVPMDENTPQEPADYYGTSKLLGEVILRNHAAQFDIPFSITRFATVVSPEEAARFFRVKSMRAMFAKARLARDSNIWQLFQRGANLGKILDAALGQVPEDDAVGFVGPAGDPWTIHLVDVRDAVEGVFLALTSPTALGDAFNITADRPTSHVEGATVTSEVFGVAKHVVEMPFTWRLEMKVDAARDALGYRPKYDYSDMVHAALRPSGDYLPVRI